jgi:hypothetical protein
MADSKPSSNRSNKSNTHAPLPPTTRSDDNISNSNDDEHKSDIETLKAQYSEMATTMNELKNILLNKINNNNNNDNDNNINNKQTFIKTESAPIPIFTNDTPSSYSPPSSSSIILKAPLILTLRNDIKLPATVDASSFATFRDSVIRQVKGCNLFEFIDLPLTTNVQRLQNIYTNASHYVIISFAKQQSRSMAAIILQSLGVHANAIEDKIKSDNIKRDTDDPIIDVDDVYTVWNIIINKYQKSTPFHRVAALQILLAIKHNHNDDPTKTRERIMVIYRQLIQAGTVVPDEMLAAILLGSMPPEMAATQQYLNAQKIEDFETVYDAMKTYYDSKILKSKIYNNNNNNNDTAKALVMKNTTNKNTDVCRAFQAKGNCRFGNRCRYTHDSKSKQNDTNDKSAYDNNNESDDDIFTVNMLDDCAPDEIDIDDDVIQKLESAAAYQSGLEKLHIKRANEVLLDSGASRNTCCTKRLLTSVERVTPIPMLGITGKVSLVNEVGIMKINNKLQFKNTIYVPNASTNLISVSTLYKNKCRVEFSETKASIHHKSTLLATFKLIGGVYIYTFPSNITDIDTSDEESDNAIINKPSTVIPRKSDKNVQFGTVSNKPPTTATTLSSNVSSSTTARSILTNARSKVTSETTSNKNTPTSLVKLNYFNLDTLPAVDDTNTSDVTVDDTNIDDVDTDYVCIQKALAHVDADIMHARFGHYGQHTQCETCTLAKGRRKKIGDISTRPTALMVYDRLHMDLIGPISTVTNDGRISAPSIGGNKYILLIVDEKSKYKHVILLRRKSDATMEIIKLIRKIRTQYHHLVKGIHSDRGGEFLNTALKTYCDNNGIVHTTSTAYTPQHNGLVERTGGTSSNNTRAMMTHAKAHISLWGEASTAEAYVDVRTSKTDEGKTPYEQVNHVKPNTKHLRVWGCDAFIYVQPQKRGKFDAVKEKCIFIGYSDEQNAYRVLLPNGTIKVSRDVQFLL